MRSSLALAALMLTGCAVAAQQPPVHGETPGYTCNNSGLQQFVGQTRSAELEAQMLRLSGARTVRWVPQGTAVTMEFRSDRLTVFLDAQNRVERLGCS
jgi:outer membrane biogenesis lipoprotein LolB